LLLTFTPYFFILAEYKFNMSVLELVVAYSLVAKHFNYLHELFIIKVPLLVLCWFMLVM